MITLKAEFHHDYYCFTWGLIYYKIPMKDPIFRVLYEAGLTSQFLVIKSYDLVRIEDFDGYVFKVLSTADAHAFVSNFFFHFDNFIADTKDFIGLPS